MIHQRPVVLPRRRRAAVLQQDHDEMACRGMLSVDRSLEFAVVLRLLLLLFDHHQVAAGQQHRRTKAAG